MQSLTQTSSGLISAITGTTVHSRDDDTEGRPVQSEAHTREAAKDSTAPGEAVITSEENGPGLLSAQAQAAAVPEPAVESVTEPSLNDAGAEMDTAAKPSRPAALVPNKNKNSCVQKVKKQDKGVRDGRKCIPSKKAMIDPLKMDMSKPPVVPLTSSQLSLQCIECHIIFSDHKSKERHLKLSHPAEYEQCILRNALFACYVCDRHFTNSTELMAHQKTHVEKKPFKCPICAQAFKKISELTLHKKVHYGQGGYACADCGKPCKTLTLLKYHHRTHTGERPYVCRECGKRFSMSKALQKHMESHGLEGAEGQAQDCSVAAKAQPKKNDGASTIKYPCSICKAIFKSTKTRLRHIKTKHNVAPPAASSALPAGQQAKQSTPIITPISICQPGLLQVEPNGPLQKVDAKIDLDQIRRLVESLGNVQKVNQVVILGQVPPNAPPLELQQIPEQGESVSVNLTPPQIDFIELKQTEPKTGELESSNNLCDSMEQTIILEPITPDGQLQNPSFLEVGSSITAAENIELTLVGSEQTARHESDTMHEILPQPKVGAAPSAPVAQMVCQNQALDLKQNLEQTVILELTSTLIPTVALEHPQTVSQVEITSSSLLPTTKLEKSSVHTLSEQETSLPAPPPEPTIELELTPVQNDGELTTCLCVPPGALTQTLGEAETNSKEVADKHMQTVSQDQVKPVIKGPAAAETQERTEPDPSQNIMAVTKEGGEQMGNLSEVKNPSAEEDTPPRLEAKQIHVSSLPINLMSAQELVKVRKRKPARAFLFQGYIQDMVTIPKDDFQAYAKPAKRQKTKKAQLVVKFGPHVKEKKNKKQKKTPQSCQPTQEVTIKSKTTSTNISEKKVPSPKKGRKGNKDKKGGHSVAAAELKAPSSKQDPQVQQMKEVTRKNKLKKQKNVATEGVTSTSEQKTEASPVFKKKKQPKIMPKAQSKDAKDVKVTKKAQNKRKKEEKTSTKRSAGSADLSGRPIKEDSLLLLKGHKQPQLKVYKLDPSKTSGQTQEALPHSSKTTLQKKKDNKTKPKMNTTKKAANKLSNVVQKKCGRPKKNQKALSLLSSVQVSHKPPEMVPTKPKTPRKRKASSKLETEGVITSKRALECKECLERFSDVSSLQRHKATVHIVESPGLTYTNGNIFEGVSRLDLYQLPKRHDQVIGVMTATTDWDTEPEIGEMALEDRERSVSFPALNPSPSLPLPPTDVEMSGYDHKGANKTIADNQSVASANALLPANQIKILEFNNETSPNVICEIPLHSCTQSKSSEAGEPLTSHEDKPICQARAQVILKNQESDFHGTADEDIKEDLLLEVDLVTVGEQNENADSHLPQENILQNKYAGISNLEAVPADKETITQNGRTLQSVSCSTHPIKEEEEEILLQRKKAGDKGAVRRGTAAGRKRGMGRLKGGVISKKTTVGNAVRERERDDDECQVVYQKPAVTSDVETSEEGARRTLCLQSASQVSQPGVVKSVETEVSAPAKCLPFVPPSSEESPEEQVALQVESVSTNVEEMTKSQGRRLDGGGGEDDRETDQSPGIIFEQFLTCRQKMTANKEPSLVAAANSQRQGLESNADNEVEVLKGQDIKIEENISDQSLMTTNCHNKRSASLQPQHHHHHDIRSVLVKQESSLVTDVQATEGSRHIRWNVEQVETENASSPPVDSGETSQESTVASDYNSNQCIFYPVKEEERELLLGTSQTSHESSATGASSDAQTGHQSDHRPSADEGSAATQDDQDTRARGLLPGPGVDDFADVQGEAETECQQAPELRDFLLQSSDEEDVSGFEMTDLHLQSEAEIMAFFSKNQIGNLDQPDELPQSSVTATSHQQTQNPTQEIKSREPIDYFSKYFGWDTWVEFSQYTNTPSNMANPVTAREVAQFVGIHIAMGTLKFPSPKLYWEDLTKVPLIAEAMPMSRFIQLSHALKLAAPANEPANSKAMGEIHNFETVQEAPAHFNAVNNKSRHSESSQFADGWQQRDNPNSPNSSGTSADPLWKVQHVLCHFHTGCQSLREQGDYAVDQYTLPLTAKAHSNKNSLHCTTLIGFGGLLLHVDLKLDLSEKEDAVEKMVPKGSMVFLCKQELSTPAMLERLLVAGVHGAGRVGGARGQIGDEFVSSDGRLMLRRSHCGFILSTAGNGQRSMVSLIDNFEKAQMSVRLNRDLQNLYCIPLTASAPTCWPQAVLWYLTDMALVNSWLLYRRDHGAASAPLTLMAFRLEVSKALILSSGTDTQDSVPPQPPTEKPQAANETPSPSLLQENPLPDASIRYDGSGHWPEQLGEGEGGRCRFGDCQRTSRVLCLKCCVFLCISRNHNCFINFHHQGSLRND